jgi:hypothetical protein
VVSETTPFFYFFDFSTTDFIASPEIIRPEAVTTVRTLRELPFTRSLSTRSMRVTAPRCDQKRTWRHRLARRRHISCPALDSSCESAGRPHASRCDNGGHRHRGMGSGRPSTPPSSRPVPSFWNGIGRCTLRMRGSCRRSWPHVADGVVRDRDGRNDRCGRHRNSVRPTENSNGLAVTFRGSAWK